MKVRKTTVITDFRHVENNYKYTL